MDDQPEQVGSRGNESCPHCGVQPAADLHRCPFDLEPDGCRCCGACLQTCADLAWHRTALDAATMVNPAGGELEISYWSAVWDDTADP